MKLSFKLFGYEIARIDLDLGDEAQPSPEQAVRKVTKPVKLISSIWVKGMMA